MKIICYMTGSLIVSLVLLTLIVFCLLGARTDIRNNAKQTPNDLARDPEVGRLLRGAVGGWI